MHRNIDILISLYLPEYFFVGISQPSLCICAIFVQKIVTKDGL